jgi:(p)ppGpp synthase/HD superfamily hydrolase
MMSHGYSDRINHALAFAAKHHDQQVRKGTRLPYLTHPANVAIILTRYGQDDDTVVAGILHDVIEDCVRDGFTREMLESRIADKFSQDVLETVLAVTHRKYDDEGIELSSEERKDDYLARLASAGLRARWVCAADKVHNASTILADLKRTDYPETVWGRFNAGREGTIRWYRRVHDRLRELGFDGAIMRELDAVARALETSVAASDDLAGPGAQADVHVDHIADRSDLPRSASY